VQILCTTKSLEKAKNFIVDTVLDAEQNGVRPNIALKAFSALAIDFALSGDLECAYEVSQICSVSGYIGLPSHVSERIQRIKEKSLA